MARNVLTLHIEVIEHSTGLWCASCHLPSVRRIVFAIDGGPRFNVYDKSQCVHCGGPGATSPAPGSPATDA